MDEENLYSEDVSSMDTPQPGDETGPQDIIHSDGETRTPYETRPPDETRTPDDEADYKTKTLGTTQPDDVTKILDTKQPEHVTKELDTLQPHQAAHTQKGSLPEHITKILETDSNGALQTGLSLSTLGEDEGEEKDVQEKADEMKKAIEEMLRRSVSWSRPDFKTDWSDFEIMVKRPRIDDSDVKIDIGEYNYRGIHLEEGKVHINETHGYTFIDTTEVDAMGNKKTVRKFVPRVYQKIRTYRKLVPVKVTFTKLTDDVELVEEEEDVNEEMEVDEIINTCLIKKTDKMGEEMFEEKEVIQEVIKYPGKKKRFIKLKMINDLGETVEEQIELNEDAKRTNDIMRLAAPYFTKKPKTSEADGQDSSEGMDKFSSMVIPDWYRAKDTHRDLIKMKVIERLKTARDEQKALKKMNRYLGKKLCEYYDLKGPKDPNFVYDERGNADEEKQKYQKRLLEFNDVVNFIFNENKKRAEMISQAEKSTQLDAEQLNDEKQKFYGLEESMIKDVDPSEECKTLRSMTFADLINQQKLMDGSLAKVRLEFIKSQITLRDLEDKKAAHEGDINNMEKVDFINFESLRVKTQDLNDKLDLKEKQVLSMKDRLTQRVQALAHVRLKSDHLTVENEKLRAETKDIIEELNALRKECLLVQIERRKLEKELSKVTSKEGLEKYPHLVNEMETVEAKGEEQLELLSKLVNTCTDLKHEMKEKLEQHRIGVEKHQRNQEQKKQKKKLFSFEFK